MVSLGSIYPYIKPLHTSLHPYVPFAPLDIFGAIRLSQIVYWVSTNSEDANFKEEVPGRKGTGRRGNTPPPVLQECLGILIVLFGGETFLAICTKTPPSWLLSPNIGLLFCLTHILQTRTPLQGLIPPRPTLFLELLLAIPDAIGRTLLLTRFSILPLVQQSPKFFPIPATPTSLILVPFILASPFAAMAFTGTNLFTSSKIQLSTPLELGPAGWLMVDAWLPLVLPALFCVLIGPTPGWSIGLGWKEEESIILCICFVSVAFVGRAIYNFGLKEDLRRNNG